MFLTEKQETIKTKLIVQAQQIVRKNWLDSIFQLPYPYQKLSCFESQNYLNCPISRKTIQKWAKIKIFFNQRLEKHDLNPQTKELVLSSWIKRSLMTKISITFRNLTYLTIVERTMGVKGARLVYKAEWKQLTKVIFNNNLLGEVGAKILSKCQWKELQQLQLNDNNFIDKSFYNLLKSNWPKLKLLTLAKNKFTSHMINMISKHPWPKLETLDFYDFDQGGFNQVLYIIEEHLNFDLYGYRGGDQVIVDAFAVFERAAVDLCISKEMRAFTLGQYAINQVAEVKKLMKEGEFSGYQNL